MTGFGTRIRRRALATCAALVVLSSSGTAQSPPASGITPRIAADASPAAVSPDASPVVPAPSSVVTPRPPDAFTVLDARFRAEYLRARRESAVRTGPVIVVFDSEKLVLYRDRRREEAAFVPPADYVLRTVAEVPMALHAALATSGDGELTPVRHTEISQFQGLIAAAQRGLIGRGFHQAVLDRQQQILAASAKLVEEVLAERTIDRSELLDFAREMAPLVLANVEEAGRARIDGMHAAVTRWRRALPAEEWARLRVVVAGRHMAREDELATQYFLKLLEEPAEGRRVVFAEGVLDESAALDMLGSHILEETTGSAFFGAENASHRDRLGAAARSYLDALNPAAPEPPPPPAQPVATDKGKKKKKREDRPKSQD